MPMPTSRPRFVLTDTGELSEMLDAAQRRWPEVRDRRELLLRLVSAGSDAIEAEGADRRRAVEQTAGSLTGTYEPDELASLREDWPA